MSKPIHVEMCVYKGVPLIYKTRSKAAIAFDDLGLPPGTSVTLVHIDITGECEQLDALLSYKQRVLYSQNTCT
jgi:hypothetical protein